MSKVDLKLVGRKCTYVFVHTVRGARQSNGHEMDLPVYVKNDTASIIAFVKGVATIQGYRELSGIEIDIEEIYQEI